MPPQHVSAAVRLRAAAAGRPPAAAVARAAAPAIPKRRQPGVATVVTLPRKAQHVQPAAAPTCEGLAQVLQGVAADLKGMDPLVAGAGERIDNIGRQLLAAQRSLRALLAAGHHLASHSPAYLQRYLSYCAMALDVRDVQHTAPEWARPQGRLDGARASVVAVGLCHDVIDAMAALQRAGYQPAATVHEPGISDILAQLEQPQVVYYDTEPGVSGSTRRLGYRAALSAAGRNPAEGGRAAATAPQLSAALDGGAGGWFGASAQLGYLASECPAIAAKAQQLLAGRGSSSSTLAPVILVDWFGTVKANGGLR